MHLLRTFLLSTAACAVCTGCAGVSAHTARFLPSSRTASSETVDEPKAKTASTPEDAADPEKREPAVASTTPGTSSHDTATQLLIATELRDAPSSERIAWMAYINSLPAAEVPKALRERRLGGTPGLPREMELEQQAGALAHQRSTEQAAPAEDGAGSHSSTSTDSILQTSAVNPATNPPSGTSAYQHSLTDYAGTEPASSPVQQTKDDRHGVDEEHGSLFPGWPDWDKNKFWHQPEGNPRLRDRLPLPKIIAGGNRDGEVIHQPPATTPEVASASPPAEVLNRPLPQPELRISPGASLWEDEVRKLIAMLEADATTVGAVGSVQQEQYVRQQVALRMLYLIAEDPQKAQRVIPQLPPSDQEFWTNVFWGLSTYLNAPDVDPMERKTQAISQLRTAVHHLQESARLQIRNLNFCHRIDGFGNYDRFPQDVFSPGDSVLLYCELRNFHSEPTADGKYESRMRSSIRFIRQNDELVADQTEFDATRDLSRTVRTDYYHAHRLDLPQLSPGAYILTLRVEDELSGKIATESIPLTIR